MNFPHISTNFFGDIFDFVHCICDDFKLVVIGHEQVLQVLKLCIHAEDFDTQFFDHFELRKSRRDRGIRRVVTRWIIIRARTRLRFERPGFIGESVAHAIEHSRVVKLFNNDRRDVGETYMVCLKNLGNKHPIRKTLRVQGRISHIKENVLKRV